MARSAGWLFLLGASAVSITMLLHTKAIVPFLFGCLFALVANVSAYAMTRQINRVASAGERISVVWYDIKEVFRRHRKLYPRSALRLIFQASTILMFVSFVVLAWLI